MYMVLPLEFILGIVSGAALLYAIFKYQKNSLVQVRHAGQQLLKEAREQAALERRDVVSRAKDEMYRRKSEVEVEFKRQKIDIERLESRSAQRDEILAQKERQLAESKQELNDHERDLSKRLDILISDESRVSKTLSQLLSRLEQISGMSKDGARTILFSTLKDEVKQESQSWMVKYLEEARVTAKQKANSIICGVMQRHCCESVTLHASSVVHLPNEEMKGRVIGKEGRNIKALEMATGMEFVIGETPEIITISGFHPIRREIAKRALTKLVLDGRINPTRIEEVVTQCEEELAENIEEMGKDTVVRLGFINMHPELVTLLGKLNFRTSFTQNVLTHSKEVGAFCRMIAEELGLDGNLAERCGLLHDIGKAVSHEVEGPHALVGADIAKRCGEDPIVVGAIASHHEEVPYTSIYGVITQIGDAISATRPGARKETLSTYIKRLEQLEEISTSFEGVKRAFALQAGREVRIIVDEAVVDDEQACVMARDIAGKVEEEMNFPGQIKVNVIREKRSIEYAR
jgi:ribonucrease Y